MPRSSHSDRIELEDHSAFLRRSWRLQRIGLAVIVVLVALGLLGLLGGNGPLTGATTGDAERAALVDYQQFLRRRASTRLAVHMHQDASARSEVVVHIKRSYIEQFEIRSINPEPVRVEAGDADIRYVFDLTGFADETTLTFHLDPQRIGPVAGRLRVDEREPVEFRQFVYP
jgi:hypothetical protein